MFDKLNQKLKNLPQHPYVAQLRDVRAVGLLLFLAVALMVSWSGAKVIQRNYDLQRQISQLRQEIAVQQLENTNLRLQNQYFNTEQYLELKARQDFGLGQPGETLLLVPPEVALAFVDAGSKPGASSGGSESPKGGADGVSGAAASGGNANDTRPAYQRNFEAWMDFFLHRQDN